ncbi:MAG: alpha-L-fucosidase [Bacteroidetes bacterium B1(2017)]|nr:MAG: alpha-L-fucosidase [Bacteroidetes bacterium B1(2017)]
MIHFTPISTNSKVKTKHSLNDIYWIISLFVLPFIGLPTQLKAQADTSKMAWFADAKLGIFIHWGIYAVDGTSESWAFHNKQVPYPKYMKQIEGFKAEKYDPTYWANLIEQSGARYTVITAKHHDGVALWDTKMNTLSIPKKSPAKKDVLTPFVEAIRKKDIKLGIYYSLIDWSHPNYPQFLKDSVRYKATEDTLRWNRFRQFYQGQLAELNKAYKPDLYWFDGDWEHSAQEWQAAKVRASILASKPNTIINGRLQGYGDYETPEQNFPVSRPNLKYWELCMTTNDNWGYRQSDHNFKTPYQIISIFADCIGMGGNLLLDIGPKADGTIPDEQVNILTELGAWTKQHQEAIFGSIAGMPQGHFYGPSTLSKDSTCLYLFVSQTAANNVYLKGLNNKIVSAEVLGTGISLEPKIVGKISWSHVPGLVYFEVPAAAQNKYISVIKLKLDKPLSLYRGKGGFD